MADLLTLLMTTDVSEKIQKTGFVLYYCDMYSGTVVKSLQRYLKLKGASKIMLYMSWP